MKPKDKEFNVIVELVKNHFISKRNEAMERCKFQQARQAPNETIANYVAKLKELALFCNFSNLTEALRDQLVCWVADHDTRVALFSEDQLTYDKAVQLATTRESALKNAARTEKAVHTATESTVKHINTSRRKGNSSKYENRDYKGKKLNDNKYNDNGKFKMKPNVDNNYVCFCCGKINNHYVDKCKLKKVTCNSCNGRGHIEKMCFKKYGKKEVISNMLLNYSKIKSADKSKMN